MKTFLYTNAGQSSGREFVLIDDTAKTIARGNTASTAINFSADATIEVRTIKEVNQVLNDYVILNDYKEIK